MSKKQYKIIGYNKINNEKIEKLLLIEKDNFTYSQYTNKDFFDFNYSDDIHFYLVFYEEEIIGYCIYFESIDFYEIYKIFISSKYRNKHIAKQIINNFNDKKIFVEVSSKNDGAIAFYGKLNFEQINIRKNYYSDNSDAIVLERN